jgi:hypothetical protein
VGNAEFSDPKTPVGFMAFPFTRKIWGVAYILYDSYSVDRFLYRDAVVVFSMRRPAWSQNVTECVWISADWWNLLLSVKVPLDGSCQAGESGKLAEFDFVTFSETPLRKHHNSVPVKKSMDEAYIT